MKKLIIILLTALFVIGLCSCDPYADDIEAMQKRIAELELQLEETDKENTEERQELQNKIDELKERLGLAEGKVDDIDTRVTTLEGLYSTLSNAVSYKEEMESRLTALNGKIDDGVRNLESKMTTEINTIKTSITNEVATIESLIDSVNSENDKEVAKLIERVEALETFQSEAKEQLGIYGTRIEDSENAIATLKTKVTSLDTRVTTLEELSAKVSDIAELASRLKDLEDNSKEKDKTITAIRNGLTNLDSKLNAVSDNYDTSWRNMGKKVSDLESTLKATIEEDEETLSLLEEVVAKINSRVGEYYHINPVTNEYEQHTFGDWIQADGYHYKKCSVCDYEGLHDTHHWNADTEIETCRRYCRDCGYSEKGEIKHEWNYDAKGTTEAEFRENYPTSLNAYGTIYKQGSYDRVRFEDIPNLYRSEDDRIECPNCWTTAFKIMNQGNGTGYYQLDYYPELDLEKYVEEADEYMLRLSDIEGTRVIYLRNYYVVRTVEIGSDVTVYKWAVEDGKMNYYKDGVLKATEDVMEGSKPLEDFVDWDDGHSWNNNGYAVGGEVYFMSFNPCHLGEYDFCDTVSFKVIDGQFVEVDYLNITNRASK